MVAHTAVYTSRRKATASENESDNEVNCVARVLWILVVEDISPTQSDAMDLFGNFTLELQLVEESSLVVVRTTARRLDTKVPVGRVGEADFRERELDNHHGLIPEQRLDPVHFLRIALV
jgi:hypothetical protein